MNARAKAACSLLVSPELAKTNRRARPRPTAPRSNRWRCPVSILKHAERVQRSRASVGRSGRQRRDRGPSTGALSSSNGLARAAVGYGPNEVWFEARQPRSPKTRPPGAESGLRSKPIPTAPGPAGGAGSGPSAAGSLRPPLAAIRWAAFLRERQSPTIKRKNDAARSAFWRARSGAWAVVVSRRRRPVARPKDRPSFAKNRLLPPGGLLGLSTRPL